MIALKNEKIDYKTKVDLFAETAKFLGGLQLTKTKDGEAKTT